MTTTILMDFAERRGFFLRLPDSTEMLWGPSFDTQQLDRWFDKLAETVDVELKPASRFVGRTYVDVQRIDADVRGDAARFFGALLPDRPDPGHVAGVHDDASDVHTFRASSPAQQLPPVAAMGGAPATLPLQFPTR